MHPHLSGGPTHFLPSMKPPSSSLIVIASFACLSLSRAALIANYDFTTDLTSNDNEATSSASAIQSGGGIGAVADAWGRSGSLSDLFIRSSVTSAALTADDYVSFTVTTTPGTIYNFTTLSFKYSAQIATGGTGPFTSNAVVRSSLDNFATDLGTFSVTRVGVGGTNIATPQPSVDLSAFTNVSGTVEFRIYVFDDVDNANNQNRFDNITLNADIVPEPSGVSLLAGSALLIALRRRR